MKDPRWKQASPIDQLVVLRGALEGHLSNWEDDVISGERFLLVGRDLLDQMKALEPFLRGEEAWEEDRAWEIL